MFSFIWHTFFFDPVYNTLVFFIDVLPGGDLGLAITATVVLVKVILLPVSIQAIRTTKVMKEIEPKLKAVKDEMKDDKEAYAKAVMAIYKEAKLNPVAGIFLALLQLPVIFAIYFSVYDGGGVVFPAINTALLYGFIPVPELVSMNFLGFFDITEKSVFLAVLAGITQYIQIALVMPKMPPRAPDAVPDMKEEFMRNMQLQMKYVMPFIIAFVAYTISAAIALYFVVSNLVAIASEYYVRRHR